MTRWLAFVASLWLAAPVAAQPATQPAAQPATQPVDCAEGRVRVEGRCCWPGQDWADERGRCEGPPQCPEGRAEHGDDCVPVAATPSLRDVAPLPPTAMPETPTLLPPGTTTASWPLAVGSPSAPEARTVTGRGEDEALITIAFAIFDLGWSLGWLGLLLDEVAGCVDFAGNHISCESFWWGFAPLFGAMTGSLANHSGGRRQSFVAFPFGITSICLQGIGIIAIIIALANETTEPTFQRLDLSDSVTASIVPIASGSDAGLTMSLSF